MKILTANQIKSVDQFTIDHTPISSVDLMEQAGLACANTILQLFPFMESFCIYCGTGNNGGDGLVIARHLINNKKNVRVVILRFSSAFTDDFNTNLIRLKEINSEAITEVHDKEKLPDIPKDELVIDAIFGSGLNRKAEGLAKEAIISINASKQKVVSVDLPSGLFSEDNDDNNSDGIVQADYTLSFEIPKLAFYLPSNKKHLGQIKLLEIGLNKECIKSLKTPYQIIDIASVAKSLIIRNTDAHKGIFGHALLISGSYGKMGAAILSSKGCLRSGVGLLTVLVPECGYDIIQTSVPESMVLTSEGIKQMEGKKPNGNYNSIGIGPGIGTNAKTMDFIENIVVGLKTPIVLDADALNIISKRKKLLDKIPKDSILTPHPKEFERIFGDSKGDYNRLQKQVSTSVKYKIIIILKGSNTSISLPDGSVVFNSSGNPGMATAGSGDVLTGIITGLLAQGYKPKEAAILGVFLHGLAGDFAKSSKGEESMIATDIVENIAEAYLHLHKIRDNIQAEK